MDNLTSVHLVHGINSHRNTGHYKNYKSGKLALKNFKSFTGSQYKKKKIFNLMSIWGGYICKNFLSHISSSVRKGRDFFSLINIKLQNWKKGSQINERTNKSNFGIYCKFLQMKVIFEILSEINSKYPSSVQSQIIGK